MVELGAGLMVGEECLSYFILFFLISGKTMRWLPELLEEFLIFVVAIFREWEESL